MRLLVAASTGIDHARFRDLPRFLAAGDLVVVNTSGTLAAAVDGRRRQGAVTVHLSTALPDGTWAVELRPGRRADGPVRDVEPGDTVELPGGRLHVVGAVPGPGGDRRRGCGGRGWSCRDR